jgi:hypothetical protein
VYHLLIRKGTVSSSLEFDDWISHAKIWSIIADKCVLHNMFSLSLDLYAQAILKDTSVFRVSTYWYAYAKSCYKCGRLFDAQLAIKVCTCMRVCKILIVYVTLF